MFQTGYYSQLSNEVKEIMMVSMKIKKIISLFILSLTLGLNSINGEKEIVKKRASINPVEIILKSSEDSYVSGGVNADLNFGKASPIKVRKHTTSAKNDEQGYIKFSSVFLLINTIVLGITHGFCTSLAFSLAPLFVKDKLKGRAGSSVSLFLVSGIFTGTCCAFIMDVIITAIKKK